MVQGVECRTEIQQDKKRHFTTVHNNIENKCLFILSRIIVHV